MSRRSDLRGKQRSRGMEQFHSAERREGAQWIAHHYRPNGSSLRSPVMKKRTKRLLGGVALAAAGAYLKKKNSVRQKKKTSKKWGGDVWARPGMLVTFRAELMPGRDRDERTFRVKALLPSGRVSLDDAAGEHAENEFERAHAS